MFNARETIGGEALTVYNLDDPPTRAVLDELKSDGRVFSTTHVALNSGE